MARWLVTCTPSSRRSHSDTACKVGRFHRVPTSWPLMEKNKVPLYGKNGWIGGMLIELIKAAGDEVVLGDARLENREAGVVVRVVKPTP